MTSTHHLRVLIANHRPERVELLSEVVIGLGHEVVAREVHVDEVAHVTARVRPDVALVGVGETPEHSLKLIAEIVRGSYCPVITLLEEFDGDWIDQAAERGVFAYIVDTRPEELQSALDITLRRFAEVGHMRGAFDQREQEALREAEVFRRRQREVLELQDGVVQQLGVAHLALELDRREDSREALLGALDHAREIVSRAMTDLQAEGVPLEQLIRDAAPS